MNKHSINEILKKANVFSFDLVTDVYYSNQGIKRTAKRKAVFIHHLKEALENVKQNPNNP